MAANPAPQPQVQDLDTLDKLKRWSIFHISVLHNRISEVQRSVAEMSELFQNYPQLQETIRTIAANYETLIDTLQIRASTVDFATPVPTTVQEQLKEMKATIEELQAKLAMSQDSKQAASTSEATRRALRFH